ncbi:hypothetical protein [Aurantimonas sp. 22II-16-19i]|uniref:hypothetical protein n=1 Tax=Aurantimonas sp. 22II-16-19i TaxID=1317114 RepID=UPI0009F7BE2C|nr:hypothetical protein [Aurantimonas sp. 22II-16-19i]ORE98453.1 hypothetical protein ATO4_03025 [Aurantimonas sp. 22II-16-19i]
MAARSLFLGISAVLALSLLGCAARPKTCYVTLSAAGQPTAEACESGPVLMVRPITATNAAYYVPPYVLGALSYEGFLVPEEAQPAASHDLGPAPASGAFPGGFAAGMDAQEERSKAEWALEGSVVAQGGPLDAGPIDLGPVEAGPLGTGSLDRSEAGSLEAGPPEERASNVRPALSDGPTAGQTGEASAGSPFAAWAMRGPAPENRIRPENPSIGGEVIYRRPYEGLPTIAISRDLFL